MVEKHTPTEGPWRISDKAPGTVVADAPVPGVRGSDATEYYGGHLIAESIAPQNLPLIAAARSMFAALQLIANGREVLLDDGTTVMVEQDDPAAIARAAIRAATGEAE